MSAKAIAGDWSLAREHSGVTVYLRDYGESPIPEFKAITIIEAPMASIVTALLDVPAHSEWVHQCASSQVITTVNPHEQYIYQIIDLPWARDRDAILHGTLQHADNAAEIKIELHAKPDFCDSNPLAACGQIDHDKYLRVTHSSGSYTLRRLNDKHVEVTWRQHLEPGGNIPAWMIKSKLTDLPMKSLAALHRQVKKEKYRHKSLTVIDGELSIIDGDTGEP